MVVFRQSSVRPTVWGRARSEAALVGWGASGFLEADASVAGVGLDGVVPLVDHNMVVEPAEGDEIVWFCGSAFRPGCDVVDLKPVSAVAGVAGALVVVAMEDGAT